MAKVTGAFARGRSQAGGRVGGLAEIISLWLPVVMLVSIRVGVALSALPQPFGALAPPPMRAALSVILAMIIVLPRIGQLVPVEPTAVAILVATAGEVLVGAVIGLTVRVTLVAAELAGTMAGFSMGLGFATSVDPNYGDMVLPTTKLLGALSTLIFFVLEGHHAVIGALATSVDIAAPGAVVAATMIHGVFGIGTQMMARGLQVAGPVMATMFIVQLGTALSSKAAPKVNLFVLAFGVAAGAGMLTILVAAPSLATAIGVEVRRLPAELAHVLGGP